MIVLRIIVFYAGLLISVLIPIHVSGQFSYYNYEDTIIIKEVVISRKANITCLPGFKKEIIDTANIRDFSHGTLADLLSGKSLLFVKNYGPGGVATSSFRGIGASHTQVAWNGININSPMLGQSDLTLIPAGFIDDIQISYGGGSMELNSGGLGGIINLETSPEWKKNTLALINSGFGSYGRWNGLISFKTGNTNFQSVTKGFMQYSKNNFRYLNTHLSSEPVWQTRQNSQTRQKGFIQELYFRKKQSVLSARLWYQSASRNIPVPMIVHQMIPGEKQNDESFRTLLNYNYYRGENDYSLVMAFISDRLNYSNPTASIDSKNLASTLTVKTGLKTSIDKRTAIKLYLNEEINIINSNNYSGIKTRNILMLTGSAESYITGRIGAFLLVRGIVKDNDLLNPDFSAGVQLKILSEKDYYLKANVSRNSKMPTLNDMFWMPGGNPDLKNEYGYSTEVGWEMNGKQSSPCKFKADLTLFRNAIRDMIHWHPGEYSYWTADNIRNVNTYGLESSIRLGYTAGKLSARVETEYSYTKAYISDGFSASELANKQLLYVPVNQFTTVIRLDYKRIQSSFLTNFAGKRFITVDNSQYLPAYVVNDLNLGMKMNPGKSSIDINFIIENIFNATYQTIAWYPLPGRSYLIRLIFQITR